MRMKRKWRWRWIGRSVVVVVWKGRIGIQKGRGTEEHTSRQSFVWARRWAYARLMQSTSAYSESILNNQQLPIVQYFGYRSIGPDGFTAHSTGVLIYISSSLLRRILVLLRY